MVTRSASISYFYSIPYDLELKCCNKHKSVLIESRKILLLNFRIMDMRTNPKGSTNAKQIKHRTFPHKFPDLAAFLQIVFHHILATLIVKSS